VVESAVMPSSEQAATSSATSAAHTSALQATWVRMKQNALRHAIVLGALCLGIALLLTVMDGKGFGSRLVYSLCVGVACNTVVDSTRLALAWFIDRMRQARGLMVSDSPSTIGWRGAIPGSLLAMVIGPPVGLTLGDWLTGYQSGSMFDWSQSSSRIIITISLLGTVISVVVLSTFERLASARAQAEQAQRQATETQLRLLQSQLEPHMLFNTLANLRVLIGMDAQRAQTMLDHMVAYLRATLNASRTDLHPLATEFERLADYLALMGVRMGARLQVSLELPDALRQVPVPPLLLQPLVENAIKHGLEPHVQGGHIRVSARVQGQHLILDVRDTGVGLVKPPAAAPVGTSFGLTQVRERLATLHGAAASLQLSPAPDAQGGTLVSIHLPLAR
jgi:signal transduction histidine kinase